MSKDLNFVLQVTGKAVECPLVFDNTTCGGSYKLAQRVMTMFFEDSTTAAGYKGTGILNRFKGGTVGSEADLQATVQMALGTIKDTIQRKDYGKTLPDSEALADVRMVSLSIPTSDSVSITVQIVSRAGEAYLLTLPTNLLER